MKQIGIFAGMFFSLGVLAGTGPNSSDFEFAKAIFKVKGTVHKMEDKFVILPEGNKDKYFVPAYLPDEYKVNGLKVTFDGDLGKPAEIGTSLNVHKIWVEYEIKEKYKLAHKSYDLD